MTEEVKKTYPQTQYVFNPTTRMIDFSQITGFNRIHLLKIRNTVNTKTIYLNGGGEKGYGGAWSENVLTLENTSNLGNPTDILEFSFDEKQDIITSSAINTPAINTDLITGLLTTNPNINYLDVSGYKQAIIVFQINGTTTAGQVTIEGANNINTFRTLQAQPSLNPNPAVTTSAISLIGANTSITFAVDISRVKFLRLRVSTAFVGVGSSIQVAVKLEKEGNPLVAQVFQGTASNLAVTLSGSSNNVNATISNLPTSVADVSSGTITATGSSTAITTAGNTYSAIHNITAISEANASVQLIIEESLDAGTTWQVIYMSQRLTAVGQFQTPALKLRGTRIRYTWLVEGTSPSIRRSITRLHKIYEDVFCYQVIDYAFDVAVVEETSRLLETNGNTSKLEAVIVCSSHGGTGGNPIIVIEGSMCRTNMAVAWVELQSITIDSAKAYYTGVINASMPFLRARVKTNAPTGTIIDYVSLKAIA